MFIEPVDEKESVDDMIIKTRAQEDCEIVEQFIKIMMVLCTRYIASTRNLNHPRDIDTLLFTNHAESRQPSTAHDYSQLTSLMRERERENCPQQ